MSGFEPGQASTVPTTSTITEAPTQTSLSPEASAPSSPAEALPAWPSGASPAFRFCFVYFGLYVLTTQMLSGLLPLPGLNVPDLSFLPPVQATVVWVGEHVLGLAEPVSLQRTGSGDRMYNWVHAFTLLLIASAATLLWTLRAGRRAHPRLYEWFRLFIRLALGTTWISYGFAKVVPLQMPVLTLTRLVEPFGHFSPMGVLWSSIGAAPAYEMFIGAVEVAAGVLLLIPRTAALGMILCLIDATAVFALNMTYDVPVKLFSFHLILMAIFLIAPNGGRLVDLFLRQKSTSLLPEPPLGRSASGQRSLAKLQVVFALWVVCLDSFSGLLRWTQFGGGAPRSALFGIWEVQRLAIDGVDRPLLVSDTAGIRRAIFQSRTDAHLQHMNDLFTRYTVELDAEDQTLTLTSTTGTRQRSTLTYERPTRERLVLSGLLNGRQTRMELSYRDPDSYLVRSRGFKWIQEAPFNR